MGLLQKKERSYSLDQLENISKGIVPIVMENLHPDIIKIRVAFVTENNDEQRILILFKKPYYVQSSNLSYDNVTKEDRYMLWYEEFTNKVEKYSKKYPGIIFNQLSETSQDYKVVFTFNKQ